MQLTKALSTRAEFEYFMWQSEARQGYERPQAFALGLARFSPRQPDKPLDVLFPQPNKEQHFGSAAILAGAADYLNGNVTTILHEEALRTVEHAFTPFFGTKEHPNALAAQRISERAYPSSGFQSLRPVVVFIGDLSKPPETVADVYLRLHLLSHRLTTPNTINLDGTFNILPNVVWTSAGPMHPDEVPERRIATWGAADGFSVLRQDKFPRMMDYVTHPDLRVLPAGVRLGAHIGRNCVLMEQASMNFNSGCGENCMVEGRIPQGVWVGNNSDIGGGASMMGTLSGGGTERVSVGDNCLLGAESGLGIPLPHRSTVEANLYVTAGMPVLDVREGGRTERKAIEYARDPRLLDKEFGLLFLRNSLTGAVEVRHNRKPNKPNTILHSNT